MPVSFQSETGRKGRLTERLHAFPGISRDVSGLLAPSAKQKKKTPKQFLFMSKKPNGEVVVPLVDALIKRI